MFWILAGALTAIALATVITPLRREHKTLTFVLIFLLPLAALTLYWFGGNPELAQ